MTIYLYMDDGSLTTSEWQQANECVDDHPAVEGSEWVECDTHDGHSGFMACLKVHTYAGKPIGAEQLAAYVKLQGYKCEVCNDNHG